MLVTGYTSVSLAFPGTPLSVGSEGESVRLMQNFLSELRKPYPSLPKVVVDGVFGTNTENAVKGFQRLFGLEPTGIIDEITWYTIIEKRNDLV